LAFALSWTGAFSCAYAALLVVKIERLVPASGPALDTITGLSPLRLRLSLTGGKAAARPSPGDVQFRAPNGRPWRIRRAIEMLQARPGELWH